MKKMVLKKGSPLITECIGSSIRRSMCKEHARKVMARIQRSGISLPAKMNFSPYYFRANLDTYFPPKPYRSTHNFSSWMMYGTRQRFKDQCLPWVEKAIKSLKSCALCRAASKNPKNLKHKFIHGEGPDYMYEADDRSMIFTWT